MVVVHTGQDNHIGRDMGDKLRLGRCGGIVAQDIAQRKPRAAPPQINPPEGQPQITRSKGLGGGSRCQANQE